MTIIGVGKGRYPHHGEYYQFKNGIIKKMTEGMPTPFWDDPKNFTILKLEEDQPLSPRWNAEPVTFVDTGDRRYPSHGELYQLKGAVHADVMFGNNFIAGPYRPEDVAILRHAEPGEYVRFTSFPVDSLRAMDIERLRLINRQKEQEMADLRTAYKGLKRDFREKKEKAFKAGYRMASADAVRAVREKFEATIGKEEHE